MRIELDINNHVPNASLYRPGSTIHGLITVWGPVDNDCSPITLRFYGISDVSIYDHWPLYTVLCEETQVLSVDDYPPQIAHGKNVRVAFSFKIPEKTKKCKQKLSSELPWTMSRHSLPPTMVSSQFDVFSGRIDYTFGASMQQMGRHTTETAGRNIIIRGAHQPLEKAFHIDGEKTMKSITQKLIVASLAAKDLSLVENQCRIVQAINLVAKLPTKMDLNHTIPILLRSKLDTQVSATELIPEIRVIQVKHTITSETHLRLSNPNLRNSKPLHRCFEGESEEGVLLSTTDDTDIAEYMDVKVSDRECTESFRSFSMAKEFRSSTTVTVVVGRERIAYTAVFEVDDLEMFPDRTKEAHLD